MKKDATYVLIQAVLDKTLEENICLPGEIKSRYQAAREYVKLKITRFKKPTLKKIDKIYEKNYQWATATGWENKIKHPCTSANFIILLAENINDLALHKMFFDVYKYYEAGGRVPAPSDWSGARAFDKWQETWKKGA